MKSALWLMRSAVTLSVLAFVQAVWASESIDNNWRVSDLPGEATTANEWLAQVAAATVQVTGVRVNRTSTGLEITLETAEGKPLQVNATKFRTEGNSLIADISNAVLVLPNAGEFSADNPTEAIASVRVVQLDASNIRVSVTGKETLPTQRACV